MGFLPILTMGEVDGPVSMIPAPSKEGSGTARFCWMSHGETEEHIAKAGVAFRGYLALTK